MYDGKKFADIIRPLYRTEVEYFLSCTQIDSPVFHRSGIAAASSVNGDGIRFHFHRERENRIISIGWYVLKHLFGMMAKE